eukprot:m.341687 g.341687  ORF g.341687 m.341687 type:complete len:137 (+) comp20355_c0_seq1:130-540(+)
MSLSFRTLALQQLRLTRHLPQSALLSTTPLNNKSAPVSVTKFLCLRYSYVDNMLEKRTPYRADHINAVSKLDAAGKVAISGAFNEPCDGALFLFHEGTITQDEIKEFAKTDPYVVNGLVTSWQVSEYMGVRGSMLP